MSDKTANLPVFESEIRPMAIPDTGFLILIPASISARVPAQTVAIEDDPLDSRISETTLTAYGFSSPTGTTYFRALSARFPCPISLLPVPLYGFASPVEKGGKL